MRASTPETVSQRQDSGFMPRYVMALFLIALSAMVVGFGGVVHHHEMAAKVLFVFTIVPALLGLLRETY